MHVANFFIVHHQIVMLQEEWNPVFLHINHFVFRIEKKSENF